jgi:4-amino-4-deoxy-L-arabinose transferase-like glycosyltransferase
MTTGKADEFVRPARWTDWARGPTLVFALVLFSIVVINPLREMVAMDDSWAYARTVQHLLATGRYQLAAWAAANMPVQIYLAAGLSKIFGYSLSLLRCSTLALLIVGLFSFQALLLEHNRPEKLASAFTLALLSSPLVLVLAFTFMSDVQFLGWMLLALWLYTTGLRRQSATSMFLGSLGAGCAIGTRQFGIAIIGGLALCWLATSRDRRPPVRLLLAGLVVPLLAAGLQLLIGLAEPNITQALRLSQQQWFLHRGTALLPELFWRTALIVQYTGMAMLPVLPFAFLRSRSTASQSPHERPLVIGVMLLSGAAIVAALSMSSFLTARPEALHHGIWEPLELWWLLPTQLEPVRPLMYLLDFGGIIGGAVLMGTCFRGALRLRQSKHLSPERALLVGTVASLFVLNLFYVQMNDTYIAVFIPFALLVFAIDQRANPSRRGAARWSLAISISFIVALSFYIRGENARLDVQWKAADRLVRSGVPPANIVAPLAWQEYHGAFDQWIAAGAPGFRSSPRTPPRGWDSLHGSFYPWLRERDSKAEYLVFNGAAGDKFPSDWQILSSDCYRNAIFLRRVAWTVKRPPAH